MTRENQLLVRLSNDEKSGFEQAAKWAGISTSAWARQKLRYAAARELRDADILIPFLEQPTQTNDKTQPQPPACQIVFANSGGLGNL